ncbi:ABC transporter substrate-binding protein [Alcaligenaceae bacterium]|nr:ABC transporter substrate-binding protein [Alcaligenaceae bacterium]
MIKVKNLCHVFLAMAAIVAMPAQANQLEEIKKKGELVCGTLGTSQPFSFQDTKTRQVVGYDVDFCKLIADGLGVKVNYKLLSVAARIPELSEGRVDIVAANLGYSEDRAKQIDFSHMYYITPQKLLVRADSGLKTLEQLDGLRIGATRGSSSEREIKKHLPKSDVIGYADSSAAYLALQQKKVSAQFASELALVRLMLQSPESSPLEIMEKSVFDEPWGLGIRKGEEALLQAVNKILDDAEASGEAARIFEKWFGQDTQYKIKRSFTIQPLGN